MLRILLLVSTCPERSDQGGRRSLNPTSAGQGCECANSNWEAPAVTAASRGWRQGRIGRRRAEHLQSFWHLRLGLGSS